MQVLPDVSAVSKADFYEKYTRPGNTDGDSQVGHPCAVFMGKLAELGFL